MSTDRATSGLLVHEGQAHIPPGQASMSSRSGLYTTRPSCQAVKTPGSAAGAAAEGAAVAGQKALPAQRLACGNDEESGDGGALEAERRHRVDGAQEEAEAVEAGDEGPKVEGSDGDAACVGARGDLAGR